MSEIYKKLLSETPIGDIVVIWSKENNFQIEEIIIATPEGNAQDIASEKYPEALKADKTPKKLKRITKDIKRYFNKKDVKFSLDNLNMEKLTDFEKEVLINEFNTERGTVNTFAGLAKLTSKPKGYRAVGTALSNNPFPIIIPCHRTVKADRNLGGVGGFKGGIESKQILLEIEGIEIENERVKNKSAVVDS